MTNSFYTDLAILLSVVLVVFIGILAVKCYKDISKENIGRVQAKRNTPKKRKTVFASSINRQYSGSLYGTPTN